MANGLYDAGRDAFLGGDNDWDNDHRLILHDDAEDTPNLTTDEFLDDVAEAARVAVSAAVTPSHSAGIADMDDVTFSEVEGDPAERVICYQHTGTEEDSLLVANVDSATGLPVTPNGADITFVVDNGTNKFFKL